MARLRVANLLPMRILGELSLQTQDTTVMFVPIYNHQMQRRARGAEKLILTVSPSSAMMRLTKKVSGAMGELMWRSAIWRWISDIDLPERNDIPRLKFITCTNHRAVKECYIPPRRGVWVKYRLFLDICSYLHTALDEELTRILRPVTVFNV